VGRIGDDLRMDYTPQGHTVGLAQRMEALASGGSGARNRFDLSRARGFARFVGRDAEPRTLEAALERTRRGEGQVLGIVADAGTGNSQLCFEFVEHCRAEGVQVMGGRCVAHGEDLPLLPVLEVIRDYFGIEDGDRERVVREKIGTRRRKKWALCAHVR